MSKKIVLTSCGILNENLKKEFYKLLNKEIEKIKVLYITAAIDGEDYSNTSWIDEEFKIILDLGINKENIKHGIIYNNKEIKELQMKNMSNEEKLTKTVINWGITSYGKTYKKNKRRCFE